MNSLSSIFALFTKVASTLILLALCFVKLSGQTIWLDDFSMDRGWSPDPKSCGARQSIMGVINGQFRWQDLQGDCCMNETGDSRYGLNNSVLLSPSIDLQGACLFNLSFDYAWGDRLECFNPARSKDSCGHPSFGQDQFWFEYSLDGGLSWLEFFNFCETGSGQLTFTSYDISSANASNLIIRIHGGVQDVDEWFVIDNFSVNKVYNAPEISLPEYHLCIDEGPTSLPLTINGVSGIWEDMEGNQIFEVNPSLIGVDTFTLVFRPMDDCIDQTVFQTEVRIEECFCVFDNVRIVSHKSLEPSDCDNIFSYYHSFKIKVYGPEQFNFTYKVNEEDSVTFFPPRNVNSRNRIGGAYFDTIICIDSLPAFETRDSSLFQPILYLLSGDSENFERCDSGRQIADSFYLQFPPYDFSNSKCPKNQSVTIENVDCNTQMTQSLGDDQISFDLTINSIQPGSCEIIITDLNNSGPPRPLPLSKSIIEYNKTERITLDIGSNQLVRPQLQAYDSDGTIIDFMDVGTSVLVPNPSIVVFDEVGSQSFNGISNLRCDSNMTTDPIDDRLIFDLAATGVYDAMIDESHQVFNGRYSLNILSPDVHIASPSITTLELSELSRINNPIKSEITISLNGTTDWPELIFLSVINDSIPSCEMIITLPNVCSYVDTMPAPDTCGLKVDKLNTQIVCASPEPGNRDWHYSLNTSGIVNTRPGASSSFRLIYEYGNVLIQYGESSYDLIDRRIKTGDVIYFEDANNPDCRDSIVIGALDDCCESIVYSNISATIIDDRCNSGLGSVSFGESIHIESGVWEVDWSTISGITSNIDQFDGSDSAANLFAGQISALLSNTLGCKDSLFSFEIMNTSNLEVIIEIVSLPSSSSSTDGAVRVSCLNCRIPYQLEINGTSYQLGQADTVFQNLPTGTYSISISESSTSCEFIDTVTLFVSGSSEGIIIPNTFDRDHFSSFFISDISNKIEVVQSISVYNRLGNQLFRNSAISIQELNVDLGLDFAEQKQFNSNETYIYQIVARLRNGNTQSITGTFIILE